MSQRENFISFRQPGSDAGGEVRENPEVSLGVSAAAHRYILLIHGYNVDKRRAKDSYEKFKWRLLEDSTVALDNDIIHLYWPGDARFRLVSEMSFPVQPKRAMHTARALAKYLAKRIQEQDQDCELIFIGHSLGCRVIVETLCKLYSQEYNNRLTPTRIFLMAAGIPVSMVHNQNRLWKGIQGSNPRVVYYSRKDKVLQYAFPVGQTAAIDDNQLLPEAVGSRGRPTEVWGAESEEMSYGHSSYWTSDEIPGKILKALHISLRRPTISSRGLLELSLPADHELPYLEVLPYRELRY